MPKKGIASDDIIMRIIMLAISFCNADMLKYLRH